MKLQNINDETDEFVFPNNPQLFEDPNSNNIELKNVPYNNFHIVVGNDTLKPKVLGFTGNLVLNDKYADYNKLNSFISNGSKVMRLFFQDDKFHYVVGQECKKTHTNNRTNFIDYVFSAVAFIPLVFSSNIKEAVYNNGSWTNGSLKNEGYIYTYIEEVQIKLNSGANVGDTIELKSQNKGGITYTLKNNYSQNEILTIKYFRYEKMGGGLYFTKYWEMYDSNENKQSKFKSTDKDELSLDLGVNESIDTYTINTSLDCEITFKFRDAYIGG